MAPDGPQRRMPRRRASGPPQILGIMLWNICYTDILHQSRKKSPRVNGGLHTTLTNLTGLPGYLSFTPVFILLPYHQGNPAAAAPRYFERFMASFMITSWAPPSMSVTGDTSVSLAFSRISGRDRAPQLQKVDRILLRVSATLSRRLPA